jgi:hypothetical protein
MDLDDPFVLCGFAAVLDGLRLLEGRDREHTNSLATAKAHSAVFWGRVARGLEDYVPIQRDRRLQENFPEFKGRELSKTRSLQRQSSR